MTTRAGKLWAWPPLLVLFAIAGLLLLRDYHTFRQASLASPVGKAAPDAAVVGLNGKPLRLSAFAGHPLWLNFFATWCPPCKSEMQQIEQRYLRYREAGLVVVGVDQQETPALVARFIKPLGLTFPIVIDNWPAAASYKVFALPTSVFVDSHGMVRAFKIGQMSAAQMDEDLSLILDGR